jgi:uncharacterized UPF0160 family protein
MSFLKKILKQKKILVTHDGSFHADDLFATATLSIVFDDNIKIVRTREQKQIESADVVYDVGGIYDPSIDRFDHHQKGGAGTRENGIPYSSFGLVWGRYGEKVCGSKEVAEKIDEKLVQSIDAFDSGINLFDVKGKVGPYLVQDIFFNFRPSWKEEQDYDTCFVNLIPFVVKILQREIVKTKDGLEAESIVHKAYEDAKDKRVIFFDDSYPWFETIHEYNEPLYVISRKGDTWRAEAVRKEKHNFESRKAFPENWAGKRDGELVEATGIPGSIFCHNGRYLVVAKTREAILALVEKALIA